MAGNLNLILIATEEWIKDKLNIETSTLGEICMYFLKEKPNIIVNVEKLCLQTI